MVEKVEKVFKRGAKKIQDHRVVIAFGAKLSDEGDTDTAHKGLVDLEPILKLWMQQQGWQWVVWLVCLRWAVKVRTKFFDHKALQDLIVRCILGPLAHLCSVYLVMTN